MKKELEAKNCLCPLPVTLVGANVNGKPNYMTIAFVGVMDYMKISIYQRRSQGKRYLQREFTLHQAGEGDRLLWFGLGKGC
jgi:flavin reductase (DIM6/NTAB) family NADH-FMN oxidoreductase RutF